MNAINNVIKNEKLDSSSIPVFIPARSMSSMEGFISVLPELPGFFKGLDNCRVDFCQLTFNINRCFNPAELQANLCVEFLVICIPVGLFNVTMFILS